ncbi:polymorphic toxin-type HINT domain-containing protein [Undibacterium sp. JH2W]|uniref:polymorphic toxin-type HINT domain-containing protein n=1 Tax=Undibacterium sp. JH2W TaxID=3413037 RepID=UPI003BF37AA7
MRVFNIIPAKHLQISAIENNGNSTQSVTMTAAIEMPRDKACFVAGTLVHTKEGLKPIEDICVGDWVLSYPENEDTPSHIRMEQEYFYKQVTKTFIYDDKPIVHITYVQPGGEKVASPLRVTPDHPFYVSKVGWVPCGELRFGSTLEAANFGNLLVTKVKQTGESARVYNIEVDEYHTYYVEKLGVWVHNK